MKLKFSECVEYMIKGPFGSDMKKSLYVPKGEDTYKVYIQGNAIQKDENLGDYYVSSEYFHQKLERFQVHPGDYIITCDGTLGKYIKLSDDIEPGVISSSLLLLKLDETKIYDKYFELLWENSMLKYLASQARNACLVHLPSAKAIGDVEIILPELSIQREIADKAFLVKNIIMNRNAELVLFDELIKARFVELFSDPVSNPLSWEKRTLKEVCVKLNDGTHFSPESYETGQYKYVTAKNIKLSGFDFSNITYVPEEVHRPIYERCNPELGDVLYIKDGATTGIAMVNTLEEEFTLLSSVALLKQDRTIMNGYFLTALLNNEDMYTDIRNNMGGAAITRLTIAKLNAIKVIVPPIELQNQFAAFVKQTDKSKAAVQAALDKAQLLFDSLMQEYFG